MVLIAFSIGMARAESKEVILVKTPYIVEEEPIGDRMSSRPINCSISEEGIFIHMYDTREILSYEIYDMNGECLMVTLDEREFTSFVLAYPDMLEIRLVTTDYVFIGNMAAI